MGKNDFDQADAIREALKNMYDRETGTAPLTGAQEEKYAAFLKMLEDKPSSCRKGMERLRHFTVFQKCAAALLCIAAVGTISLTSADALGLKFKDFFIIDNGDHVNLKPVRSEWLDGWEDFFALAEIPEGYDIVAAEDDGTSRVILYEKDQTQIRVQELEEDAHWGIDQEHTIIEEVTVRGKEGVYFCSDEYQSSDLVWMESGRQIYISSNGPEYLSKEAILKLADESLFHFREEQK